MDEDKEHIMVEDQEDFISYRYWRWRKMHGVEST